MSRALRLALAATAASALGLIVAGTAWAITPSSTFNSDAEGWTGLDVRQFGAPGPPRTLGHSDPGGNPDGFVWFDHKESGSAQDPTFFVAPASFSGDASSNYGGTISFDLRTNHPAGPIPPQILLAGSGETLYRTFDSLQPQAWTTMSASLAVGGGWLDQSGQPATVADLAAVLSNLELVGILADVSDAPSEYTDLDNVFMTEGDGLPPQNVNRTLTLRYDRAARAFKGSLLAPARPPCAVNQQVKVFRKRSGPDKLVGTDRTDPGGLRGQVPEAAGDLLRADGQDHAGGHELPRREVAKLAAPLSSTARSHCALT
jgi:Laminin B (Domain IV)